VPGAYSRTRQVSHPEIVHCGLICDNRINSNRASSTDNQGTSDEVVMAFAIELSPHAHNHLTRLRKRDHRIRNRLRIGDEEIEL
jgi:hypothetical protein